MENRKVAAISGATAGIGKAIADRFAGAGLDLSLCARTMEDLEEVREELRAAHPNINIHIKSVDVRKEGSVRNWMGEIEERWGALTVLVNNAGIFLPGSILKEAAGNMEQMVETNLYSSYYAVRAGIDLLRKAKEKAHIFNICSIASITAYPNGASYAISKWGQLGLSKCLRQELLEENIKVTAVLPGATWSRSWEGADFPEDRLMQPDHIGQMVLSCWELPEHATVEELIIRPQKGDL